MVWRQTRCSTKMGVRCTYYLDERATRSACATRSWTVVNGLRDIKAQRCGRPWFHDDSYEGFGGICPETNRPVPCGRWHPRFTPMYGMTVDDVAEQAPEGALRPLSLRRRRRPVVYVVKAAHAELYGELASGLYNDPELAVRDAADDIRLGRIGPCQASVEATSSLAIGPDELDARSIPVQRALVSHPTRILSESSNASAGGMVCARCRSSAPRLILGWCPRCAYPAGGAPEDDD